MISKFQILTKNRIRVKIGAETRDQKEGFEEIDVEKMIKHEKYEPAPEYRNDIGLLKLKHAYNNKGMNNNSTNVEILLFLTYLCFSNNYRIGKELFELYF